MAPIAAPSKGAALQAKCPRVPGADAFGGRHELEWLSPFFCREKYCCDGASTAANDQRLGLPGTLAHGGARRRRLVGRVRTPRSPRWTPLNSCKQHEQRDLQESREVSGGPFSCPSTGRAPVHHELLTGTVAGGSLTDTRPPPAPWRCSGEPKDRDRRRGRSNALLGTEIKSSAWGLALTSAHETLNRLARPRGRRSPAQSVLDIPR
jgi:hypothetical protein